MKTTRGEVPLHYRHSTGTAPSQLPLHYRHVSLEDSALQRGAVKVGAVHDAVREVGAIKLGTRGPDLGASRGVHGVDDVHKIPLAHVHTTWGKL